MTELRQKTETTAYEKVHGGRARTRSAPSLFRTGAPVPRTHRKILWTALAGAAVLAVVAAVFLAGENNPKVASEPDALDRWLANNASLLPAPNGGELRIPSDGSAVSETDGLSRWLANNATSVSLPGGGELWIPTDGSVAAVPDGLDRWLHNNPPPVAGLDGLGRWLLNNPPSAGELDALGRWLLNNPPPAVEPNGPDGH